MVPYGNPAMVESTITNPVKTTGLVVPRTLRLRSRQGKDRAGPASSKASAGPWPIPDSSSPSRMGTSVRVDTVHRPAIASWCARSHAAARRSRPLPTGRSAPAGATPDRAVDGYQRVARPRVHRSDAAPAKKRIGTSWDTTTVG